MRKDKIMALKYYKTYDQDNNAYVTCIEHPINDLYSLCGEILDDNPSGQPEEVKGPITCTYCLQIIKEIKELQNVRKTIKEVQEINP
jgi:hypothetical protein